ncbi:MAG: hypothetical protein GY849_06825 [Deltaproteobacteria bacterium]|nr:hypothetical protein [Deltaproteobacteria bacterium]
MPIQIKELIIRATIGQEGEEGAGAGAASSDREEMISECVDQVLKVLESSKER